MPRSTPVLNASSKQWLAYQLGCIWKQYSPTYSSLEATRRTQSSEMTYQWAWLWTETNNRVYCFNDVLIMKQHIVIRMPCVAMSLQTSIYNSPSNQQTIQYLFLFEWDVLHFTPREGDIGSESVLLLVDAHPTSVDTEVQICVALVLNSNNIDVKVTHNSQHIAIETTIL